MIVVDKALNILEAVLNNNGSMRLEDLAKVTGMNTSAVRRFTSTLVKRGYLFQKGKGGDYSLGLKIMRFSKPTNAAINIRELSLYYLKKLSDETSETVHMAMLNGIEVVTVELIIPRQVIQIYPEIGITQNFPPHCTALGKILLAYMPQKIYKKIADDMDFKVYTENTIADKATLENVLATVRRDNIAFDDEEYMMGLRSVAAPVRNETGNVIAAISLVSPSVRISRVKLRHFVPNVKECADNI